MGHYRAQLSFQYDSALPRDAITINPHYNADNAQALGDTLKSNLLAASFIGPATPFTVKIYDAQKAPPSYPLYTTSSGTGFVASGGPRELCLCLSYYAVTNRPRYRGRLYLPKIWVGGGDGLRPTAGQMTSALAFRTVLNSNMPGGTFLEVWSPTQQTGSGVTDFWVDDEWDIIRSRGLKGTTRQTAKP